MHKPKTSDQFSGNSYSDAGTIMLISPLPGSCGF